MTGLPWDDPDHDIGADMVETTARWIAAPGWPDEKDVRAAAVFVGRSFSISDQSIGQAIRQLGEAVRQLGEPAGGALNDRAAGDRPVDLTRRRPVRGGRITEADLDVNQDRIAEAFDAAQNWRSPRPPTLRSDPFLRVFPAADPPTPDSWSWPAPERWSWARQAGKSARLEADLQAWAAEFERVMGEPPTVVRSRGVSYYAEWIAALPDVTSAWTTVQEVQDEWHDDAEDWSRRIQEYRRVIYDSAAQPARSTGRYGRGA